MQTRIAYCIYRDPNDPSIHSQVFWECDALDPIDWQELLEKDFEGQQPVEILDSGYLSFGRSEKKGFNILSAITFLHENSEAASIMSDFLSSIVEQILASLIKKFDLK